MMPERNACPTCGITVHHLERAHSTALSIIDGCPDDFHMGRTERKGRALAREWAAERKEEAS